MIWLDRGRTHCQQIEQIKHADIRKKAETTNYCKARQLPSRHGGSIIFLVGAGIAK
ncbi:MAG: hypothetical protein K0S36_1746 [Nitrosospira multiformis]|nr:hypothetical protein [Nitrosospira multiformis]